MFPPRGLSPSDWIMARLDLVFGIANWRNEFNPGPDGGVACTIYVRINGEWIGKTDGAENTPGMEPVKGGFSGSMKRAAVHIGIGRYLYQLDESFATFNESKGTLKVWVKQDRNDKSGKNFKVMIPKLPTWALPENVVARLWTPANIKTQLATLATENAVNAFSRTLSDFMTEFTSEEKDAVTLSFRARRIELRHPPEGTEPPKTVTKKGKTEIPPGEHSDEELDRQYKRLRTEIMQIANPGDAGRWTLSNALLIKALGERGITLQTLLSDHLGAIKKNKPK